MKDALAAALVITILGAIGATLYWTAQDSRHRAQAYEQWCRNHDGFYHGGMVCTLPPAVQAPHE